jgi:hypothetical protein
MLPRSSCYKAFALTDYHSPLAQNANGQAWAIGRLANFQSPSGIHAWDPIGMELERGTSANLGFYRLFVLALIGIPEGRI